MPYFSYMCLVDKVEDGKVFFNHSVGCDQGGPTPTTPVAGLVVLRRIPTRLSSRATAKLRRPAIGRGIGHRGRNIDVVVLLF